MDARTRHKLGTVAVAVPVAAGVGLIYGVLVNPDPLDGAVTGSLIGPLICATLMMVQLFGPSGAGHGRFRRWPLWARFGVNLALAAAVVLAALVGGQALGDVLTGRQNPIIVTPSDVLFSLAVSGVFVAGATLSQVLGGEVLLGLLTGRYASPQPERRLFLLADLKGSTHLAEALGDLRFHTFLNDVFCDLAEPIAAQGGNIQRYIGDEVIVTWPLKPGGDSVVPALDCVRAMQAALADRAAAYRRRYGAVPELRYALHAGPVVTGEMGDLKREVVFLGDTVNTAARIEQAAKQTGWDVLASAAALAHLQVPEDMVARPLEGLVLKGKSTAIALCAITPRDDALSGEAA